MRADLRTAAAPPSVPTDPPAAQAPAPDRITALLERAADGDAAAHGDLFALVYDQLRRLARRQLAGARADATLSTTALVHEAFVKLSGDARWSARDRRHFFALTARAMRQVLVDYARRRARKKRGGAAQPLTLDEGAIAVDERADELFRLDEALTKLEQHDPELARIVEWRFFAGLSVEEIASTLEVSDRTVKRHWRAARAFLHQELAVGGGEP